jgi:ATP-dependent DNA helicase DinG
VSDAAAVEAALARLTGALPAGETRHGQIEMAVAIARAIGKGRHLVVQAGTGTGKSLAYLVPAILSGHRVVVVTATKALQDQLCTKDLPFVAEHLGIDFTYSQLKGRSNYVCLQRAHEVLDTDQQMGLDGIAELAPREQIVRLVTWATETETGDRSELTFEPSNRAWNAVSVSARECPGARRCPLGDVCFCERARWAASEADVVVVNTHLYGMHVASGGVVLPEHDVVVFDEAHQLEDIFADTLGTDIGPGRFTHLARATRAILADDALVTEIDLVGDILGDALVEILGERLRHGPTDALASAFEVGRTRIDRLLAALRKMDAPGGTDAEARLQRAVRLASGIADDIAAATDVPPTRVAWVEGPAASPSLRVAPIDVAPMLGGVLWPEITAVLTSATIPSGLAARVGIPAADVDELDVGSPFDYEHNALLYCATHLPDPRSEAYETALCDELGALVAAAGGRTLALFTSWRRMNAAVDALRPVLERAGIPLLAQGDQPKPALMRAFAADEATSLFATMSFWQGIDVPGRSLSLVTVDRLPFPRPDEPLMQARRELARGAAFARIDLPRATTLLAQGAGRLIRSATDRGVVAVLDPRLATSSYRWEIIRGLPPMRRTKDRAEVERFLRQITAASQ